MKLREIMSSQPYKIGDTCIFKIKNVPESEWIDYNFKKEIKPYDHKKCKIINLEDATSNEPNSNFYTIKFANGYVMRGVSGYQLDSI